MSIFFISTGHRVSLHEIESMGLICQSEALDHDVRLGSDNDLFNLPFYLCFMLIISSPPEQAIGVDHMMKRTGLSRL